MPQCPLYEEVLDTQMFGLSREIDFAVRLGLVDENDGKERWTDLKENCLLCMTRLQENK